MVATPRGDIAHLFNRAAFGARSGDLHTYSEAGFEAALEDLLSGVPNGAVVGTSAPVAVAMPMSTMEEGAKQLRDVQKSWVKVMVKTQAPLAERMVLFLADHFSTVWAPGDHIGSEALAAQQSLLRRQALGNFRSICQGLLSDVALGCFLDNDVNLLGAPNENLARELLELFLLGHGWYTETDVRELARAFTGYELRRQSNGSWKLVWDVRRHDDGPKTILGRTGRFTPLEALDVVLDHPQASRHLASCLVAHFVRPDPPSDLVEDVGANLRATGWELIPALRMVFMSQQFRADPASRQALVKSPAEWVVGAMRALKRTEFGSAAGWVQDLGQSLFRPPNVGGWTPNEGWLSAGALIARYNVASRLAAMHVNRPSKGLPAGFDVAAWMDAFGITDLTPATRAGLDHYLTRMAGRHVNTQTSGVITLLLASPEFSVA